MTADEIKATLAKAAKKAWPETKKASDLPFPEYWESAAEWLLFHAPHVGDTLMRRFIDDVVHDAVCALAAGTRPKARIVPEKIRKIWGSAADRGGMTTSVRQQGASGLQQGEIWDRAAEKAQAVRDRFERRMTQGRLM